MPQTNSVIDDTMFNDGTHSAVEPVRCSSAASLSTKRTTTADSGSAQTRSERQTAETSKALLESSLPHKSQKCTALKQLDQKATEIHSLIHDAAKAANALYNAQ